MPAAGVLARSAEAASAATGSVEGLLGRTGRLGLANGAVGPVEERVGRVDPFFRETPCASRAVEANPRAGGTARQDNSAEAGRRGPSDGGSRLPIGRRGATIVRPHPNPVTNGSTHRPKPAIRDQPKFRGATVYRPSQTPHLPLSPERVTPGGAGRLTPEARARSGLASPPHRCQTRVKLNRVFFPR
ncbi:hypothetical protein PAMA_022052 [Pampus argenteus]